MQSIRFIGLAAFLVFGPQALYVTQVLHSENQPPISQSLTGEISSSNCGLTHMSGMSQRDCTRECVDAGAEYVLIANGRMYRFANQSDPALRVHAGETVTVTGEFKGDIVNAGRIDGESEGKETK